MADVGHLQARGARLHSERAYSAWFATLDLIVLRSSKPFAWRALFVKWDCHLGTVQGRTGKILLNSFRVVGYTPSASAAGIGVVAGTHDLALDPPEWSSCVDFYALRSWARSAA